MNPELDIEVWRRSSVHKGFGSEYGDLNLSRSEEDLLKELLNRQERNMNRVKMKE